MTEASTADRRSRDGLLAADGMGRFDRKMVRGQPLLATVERGSVGQGHRAQPDSAMRFALALAAVLVAAGPTLAEQPTGTMRVVAEAVTVASLIQVGVCPSYRVNEARMAVLTKAIQMSIDDIAVRYSAYMHNLSDKLISQYKNNSVKTCEEIWDTHGANGTVSQMIEKR